MSEGDSTPGQVRNDLKIWGKYKWRGKAFASEKEGKYLRQKGIPDDDVADFLHAPSDSTIADQQHVTQTPLIETSTSSRWPSAAQVSQLNAGVPLYPRRKPRRNKKLHVTFSSATPELIGEGGEEAELPSKEVVRSWKPPKPRPHMHEHPVEQAATSIESLPRKDQPLGTVAQIVHNEKNASELVSLRRKPTRVENSRNNDALRSRDSGTDREDNDSWVSSNASVKRQSQTDARDNGEYNPRSENGMATLAQRPLYAEVEAPPSDHGVEDSKGHENVSLLQISSLEPGLLIGNSLTPTPSSQPAQKPSPSNYPFPSSRQDGLTMPQSASATSQSQYLSQDKVSPKAAQQARPPLRSVTTNLGDDTLEDFGARVQRFNEVFRLGTTASSPLTDISFAQWTRTSAWWFLKGRQELESAVRSRPRSADGPHGSDDMILSSDLKQAYLDLAKAWWISKEIIPGHPELRKYGDNSMSSLVAILDGSENADLAEVIEAHLGIVANMRALTTSMKRNNKLPPDDFEIQRLVSRVWIQYPSLTATVRSLLSAKGPQLVYDSTQKVGNLPTITVGDTKRYFNYGSMFVGVSRNDGQDQLYLPCVLTILRRRSSWDLDLAMASQDGQVNIMIQNSKQGGLTWQDVRWKTNLHVMQINISSGYIIDVQFAEKDFKILWGIRDYSQKIMKEFRCGKTEKFAFETRVRCFQCFGSNGSQGFPTEPIKDCQIRLFEKNIVLVEGTGERKVHDGHRLIVVTPPNIKTLSSFAHNLGKQTPILFSYLRGEDGAPAMLFKSPKSCPNPSLVITFNDPLERRLLHALLDGTSIANSERCSTCMPLKRFSMLEKATDETSSIANESFMGNFQWHQVRVLSENYEGEYPSRPRTIRSENLRVWADCDMGTFVDRINLGKHTRGLYEDLAILISYRSRRNPNRP